MSILNYMNNYNLSSPQARSKFTVARRLLQEYLEFIEQSIVYLKNKQFKVKCEETDPPQGVWIKISDSLKENDVEYPNKLKFIYSEDKEIKVHKHEEENFLLLEHEPRSAKIQLSKESSHYLSWEKQNPEKYSWVSIDTFEEDDEVSETIVKVFFEDQT